MKLFSRRLPISLDKDYNQYKRGCRCMELIDITVTDNQEEKADCDEVIEQQVAAAQHQVLVLGNTPAHITTTTDTTTETTTETTKTQQ